MGRVFYDPLAARIHDCISRAIQDQPEFSTHESIAEEATKQIMKMFAAQPKGDHKDEQERKSFSDRYRAAALDILEDQGLQRAWICEQFNKKLKYTSSEIHAWCNVVHAHMPTNTILEADRLIMTRMNESKSEAERIMKGVENMAKGCDAIRQIPKDIASFVNEIHGTEYKITLTLEPKGFYEEKS